MCLEIYGLDPARFLTVPARQVALKATKVQLNLLTEIDMLLIVEKVLEVECVMLFINMGKLIMSK